MEDSNISSSSEDTADKNYDTLTLDEAEDDDEAAAVEPNLHISSSSRKTFRWTHIILWNIEKNRKQVPKSFQNAKIKKEEIISQQNAKGVKLFNWKDKKNVLTFSMIPEHSGELVPSEKKKPMLTFSNQIVCSIKMQLIKESICPTNWNCIARLSGEAPNGTL